MGWWKTTVSGFACAGLVVACVPAQGLAGENATAADLARYDEAIQGTIDALGELEAGQDYVEGELLVTYSGSDDAQLVELDEGQSVREGLEDALDSSLVTAAQPNYRYRLLDSASSADAGSTTSTAAANTADAAASTGTLSTRALSSTDSLSSLQYYLNPWDPSFSSDCGANVLAAWKLVPSGSSVTIATIDTGVDAAHLDLASNIDTAHMATVTSSLNVKVGTMADGDGHGTHVAGIAAAAAGNGRGIAGNSANARLLPLRVFYQQGGEWVCNTAMVLEAYEYLDGLVESGQLTDLHVINMSLGSYQASAEDELLHSSIAHMRSEHQVLTVCAGGNGDEHSGQALTMRCYPADFDECLSVTSLEADGTNARWSDFNEYKDLSAPGVGILSTITNATAAEYASSSPSLLQQRATHDSYGYMDGTSMSAPLVAGIAALLWAANPGLSADEAVAALTSTAHAVNPTRNDHSQASSNVRPRWSWMPSYTPASGSAGAVDAAAAVSWVLENTDLTAGAGAVNQAVSAPARTVLSSVSSRTGGFKVRWKSVKNVAGYQLRWRLSSGSSWKTKSVSAMASVKTVSKLKKGRYVVQVRAYRLATDGMRIYGTWSAKKSVRAK